MVQALPTSRAISLRALLGRERESAAPPEQDRVTTWGAQGPVAPAKRTAGFGILKPRVNREGVYSQSL